METMQEDTDSPDSLTSAELANIESEGIALLTRQLQSQTADFLHSENDNGNYGSEFSTNNENQTEATDETSRTISNSTVLHCDSINYETLCTLAGTNNLGGVRNFTMRVRCPGPQDTIQRLSRLMPFLTSLYLDNSSFFNFRVFGEEVSSLKVLSVCSCGISELHGLDFLVNLRELYAAYNCINNVLDLTDLHHLTIVDLENNDVDSFDSVSFLFLSPKLHTVTFRGNPISSQPDYKERMTRYLPRLKSLDPAPRKSRLVREPCKPRREQSYSPEDDEFADLQLKVPETDQMSDDDSFEDPPPEETGEEDTEELFEKFKQNEEKFDEPVEDASLFADIEVEEEKRRERKEPAVPEAMLESPDQSFEIEAEEESCHSSISHTEENLQPENKDPQDRKFCCRKHRLLFAQSQSSIRLCATKQLYEQVSCDETDTADPVEMVEREREVIVWQTPALSSKNKIVGNRVPGGVKAELKAHEEDIKGKLLNKRQKVGPAKVKLIETKENEIEEMTMSTNSLPAVQSPGERREAKSAFAMEKKDSSDGGVECSELWDIPGSNSGTPRPGSSSSSQQLFKQGKGRPPSARPGSGSSLGSQGEGGSAGPVSVSGSDSGVDISPTPESPKDSLPSIQKGKTKDELLLMLNKIKIDDSPGRRQDMKLEDWQ